MADYRAIMVLCEAVLDLLQANYSPADFNHNELQFKVFLAKDFSQSMKAGVSLFLYRIYPNGIHRAPSGRFNMDGRRFRTQLPLDLHFLLTAWAQDASLQHTIAGWMMRVLEDTPILPAGLLNRKFPSAFHPDETVEISLTELTTEEMCRIWEVIVKDHTYQISVPYVARAVKIESKKLLPTIAAIQERRFEIGEPETLQTGQS